MKLIVFLICTALAGATDENESTTLTDVSTETFSGTEETTEPSTKAPDEQTETSEKPIVDNKEPSTEKQTETSTKFPAEPSMENASTDESPTRPETDEQATEASSDTSTDESPTNSEPDEQATEASSDTSTDESPTNSEPDEQATEASSDTSKVESPTNPQTDEQATEASSDTSKDESPTNPTTLPSTGEPTEKSTTPVPEEQTTPFSSELIVKTENGPVKGRLIITPRTGIPCYMFSCIRYAKPPTGFRRFWLPEPVENWSEVYDATSTSCPVCPQPNQKGNEDCLFLSVVVPQNCGPGLLKVMVYVHGGSFNSGSGNNTRQSYLLEECVIVVVLNYRLGALGFMALDTPKCAGNYGVKDVRLALIWVKKNIIYFGGDPNNVTLIGQSAGSAIVSALYLDRNSCSLFNQVIFQSGTASLPWAYRSSADAYSKGRILSLRCGCYFDFTDERRCECLRKVPAEVLVEQSKQILGIMDYAHFDMLPHQIIDECPGAPNPVLTEPPLNKLVKGSHCRVPVVIGVTQEEGCYFESQIEKYQLALPVLNLLIKDLAPTCVANSYNLLCTLLAPDKLIDYYTNYQGLNKNNIIPLISHVQFLLDTLLWVKILTQQGVIVYFYVYTYNGKCALSKILNPSSNWVCHADHLPYEFNYPQLAAYCFGDQKTDNPDLIVSKTLVALWANFAKTGCPTNGDSPNQKYLTGVNWQPWTENDQIYCDINSRLSIRNCYANDVMKFWNNINNLCCNTILGPSPYPVCR